MVIESVKKTGRLLVVHEATKQFSVSSEIIAKINEECFDSLKAPLSRCTGYDIVIPFVQGEGFHAITPEKVFDKIKSVLNYKF